MTLKAINISISQVALGATMWLLITIQTNIGLGWLGEINKINIWFIILTLVIASACKAYGPGGAGESAILLCLEIIIILAFLTKNILNFFILFELSVIPLYIYILYYGSKGIEACIRLLIYTLIGGVPLLIGILYIYYSIGTLNHVVIASSETPVIIAILLLLSFAVKIPLYPFHGWLPYAHVEASTTGSVILAALILKLGGYGLLVYPIEWYSDFFYFNRFLIIFWMTISTIFSCIALAPAGIDLKRLIAYSSIVHMSLGTIGYFVWGGKVGTLILMISHGILSGGLFLLIGILYSRHKSRLVPYYRGLNIIMPIYTAFLFIFILGNITFPLTSGYLAEIVVLSGLLDLNIGITIIIGIGLVGVTIINLKVYSTISFGAISKYILKGKDLNRKEFHILLVLFLYMIFIVINYDFISLSIA